MKRKYLIESFTDGASATSYVNEKAEQGYSLYDIKVVPMSSTTIRIVVWMEKK